MERGTGWGRERRKERQGREARESVKPIGPRRSAPDSGLAIPIGKCMLHIKLAYESFAATDIKITLYSSLSKKNLKKFRIMSVKRYEDEKDKIIMLNYIMQKRQLRPVQRQRQ